MMKSIFTRTLSGGRSIRHLSSSPQVIVEKNADGPWLVQLNRPPVNSLNLEFMQSIITTLDEVEKDSKGMVLTSTSKSVFCAGLDLKEMYKPEEQRLRQFWSTLQELWIRLYSLKVPCASAINGHAPAAGVLLSTACDYRVMVNNPKATIGLNEAKFGLVAPFWLMDSFVATVGQRHGDFGVLTGKLFNVEEAKNMGLVDELVATKEEAIENCTKIVKEMAKCKPNAFHMTKLQVRQSSLERLKSKRNEDVDNFVSYIFTDALQNDLGAYLASLGGGKK